MSQPTIKEMLAKELNKLWAENKKFQTLEEFKTECFNITQEFFQNQVDPISEVKQTTNKEQRKR